jgi:hypothetical protein
MFLVLDSVIIGKYFCYVKVIGVTKAICGYYFEHKNRIEENSDDYWLEEVTQ